MIAERIQTFIHRLDVAGTRRLNYLALTLAVAALAVWYDTHCYTNFTSPEAMDAAQVARNLAEGRGYTTDFIRPFDVHLLEKHGHGATVNPGGGTNMVDTARMYGSHPDLANAPLYPVILAGLFKITSPDWNVELHKPFWADGGRFQRYKPEFGIALFNQILLLAAVGMTFVLTRKIFDAPAAWLAAILMLGSDKLWKFSVSGLPVMLMLVLFLGIARCLAAFETAGDPENPDQRKRFKLALLSGFLVGLGMLTRYSFGWVIVPLALYFALFGGARRVGYAVAAFLVFTLTVSPWIVRNLVVSGTFFGTAGYAAVENTFVFSGSRLMQSLTPDMMSAHWVMPYLVKLQANLRSMMQEDVLHLGGGWMGVLFLAGLLLGLRSVAARRLRYFTLMCLGMLLIASAMGRTQFSMLSPDINAENLLVLLMPMAVVFGIAFFLTLLDQMNLPVLPMRYGVIALVVLLVRLPFTLTLLPPKTQPLAYPPYYPPDIQKISSWMKPGELVMSDIPWAVAWYGHQQCTWTTLNWRYEFVQMNDFIKPVSGLYLSLNTLDARLMSECLQGNVDNWSNFIYFTVAKNQIPDNSLRPDNSLTINLSSRKGTFPLTHFPQESLMSGLFLTDHQRW